MWKKTGTYGILLLQVTKFFLFLSSSRASAQFEIQNTFAFNNNEITLFKLLKTFGEGWNSFLWKTEYQPVNKFFLKISVGRKVFCEVCYLFYSFLCNRTIIRLFKLYLQRVSCTVKVFQMLRRTYAPLK